ncbi:MAG: ATP-binding protein [Syntrophales bacterium]|nr:ATP-binding protein [Syntrophales bacterium]
MARIPAHIRVPACMESLHTLQAFVVSCLASQGIGAARLREIELAMEEILVNIFRYAYPDRDGEVEVACRLENGGRVLVEVADRGIPFDPFSRQDPDLKAGIEERKVGGLGVFFVKQLVPMASYRREGERNILTIPIDYKSSLG